MLSGLKLNKFKSLAAIFAAMMLSASASAADMNIVVLDAARAIFDTEEAQQLIAAAQQELQKDGDELNAMRERIQELEAKVEQDGEIMTPDEIAALRKEYEELQVDFNFNAQKLQKALQEAQTAVLSALEPKLNAVLKDIIQVDQIDVILNPQTLYYINTKHDITARVTEKMNEQSESAQ